MSRTQSILHVALLPIPLSMGAFFLGRHLAGAAVGLLGVLLILAAAGFGIASFVRYMAPIRRRAQQDIRNRKIELLRVESARPVKIPADHSSIDPTFAVEVEGDRTLLLVGPWLSDPTFFGGTADQIPDDDRVVEAYANGLGPPLAFPATSFVVHRFPGSGEVVLVEITGDYMTPSDLVPPVQLRGSVDSQSYVFDCKLSDLGSLLESMRDSNPSRAA